MQGKGFEKIALFCHDTPTEIKYNQQWYRSEIIDTKTFKPNHTDNNKAKRYSTKYFYCDVL